MTASEAAVEELRRRMALPQRHRLLQGFPMVPLMRQAVPGSGSIRPGARQLDGSLMVGGKLVEPPWLSIDRSRPLIIGVIPHTQCNPRVEGCGFCTFPHDKYDRGVLRVVAGAVREQVEVFCERNPGVRGRPVTGVYFGGGTANLTPPGALAAIGGALCRNFDLRAAEVTLEGVPSLFRSLLNGPFEWLEALPARTRRISMGIQTFDAGWLARMGRQSFGDRKVVAAVTDKAHRRGFTVSGDLLVNLPHQPLEDMLRDVEVGVSLGLDQLCIYHLVLAPELGPPWSRDAHMLQGIADNETACGNWLAVREALLAAGYVQTTLTNFEKREVHQSDRRYVYEEHSFTPGVYDAIGFGPLSISTCIDAASGRAVKLLHGKSLLEPGVGWCAGSLYFPYEEQDVRLLHLTRTLARLRLDGAAFRSRFGQGALEAHVVDTLERERLLRADGEVLELTPRGMFFADAVTGLFASERSAELRDRAGGQRTRDVLAAPSIVDFMG